VQILLTPRLLVPLVVAILLLLALLVYQSSILLTPRLPVPVVVAILLLLALLVYQSSILLTPRLPRPLTVVVPLLLALLVCQPGMGLCVLLAVAISLLLALWSISRARASTCYSRSQSRCCCRAAVDSGPDSPAGGQQ